MCLPPPTWRWKQAQFPKHFSCLNVAIFWDLAPYSPYVNRRFEEKYPVTRWYLAGLNVSSEDESHTFLRNAGSDTDYTALYPRRWQFEPGAPI
jgi:hypothetical protein